MHARWLVRTTDAEKFLYSQLEEFFSYLGSTKDSETEHQQLY